MENFSWVTVMHVRGALVAMSLAGCSLGNTIDVCQRGRPAISEVNARTEGAQRTAGLQPLAPLATGGYITVFTSATAAADDGTGPSALRIAVLDSAGRPVARTCDADGENELVPATDGVRVDAASIAMPLTTDDDLGLVVYAQRTTNAQQIRGILVSLTGCNRGKDLGYESFLISDVTDKNQFASTPSVAWVGNRSFVVAWPVASIVPPSNIGGDVRLRAVQFDQVDMPNFLPIAGNPSGGSMPVKPGAGIRAAGRVDRITDGLLAVMWFELRGDTSVPYFELLDDTLATVVPAQPLDAPPMDTVAHVDVHHVVAAAYDGAQVLASWTARTGDGTLRVQGRFFTPQGQALSAPQQPDGSAFVLRPVAVEDEQRVALAPVQGGGFVAVMEELAGSSGNAIEAVAFAPDGSPLFTDPACADVGFDFTALNGDVTNPQIVVGSDGQFAAVFTTEGVDGADRSGSGVRASVWSPHQLFPDP